jgi:mannose-6-phosphate isomerase-like protein (cupin superfamily)
MDGISPTMTVAPPFPGGIGVSHLRVYDTPAPDGVAGGTPHLHTVCTEAYAVIAGSGEVHTLTSSGFRVTPLEPGAFVWFSAGTIHRLVNGGGLEILVLMANAGLPEAGDLVITFPAEIVSDAHAYALAATLPEGDRTTAGPGMSARRRRDLAVPTFLDLVAATERGDPQPLRRFHEAAAALVRPRIADFEKLWRDGPVAAVDLTEQQLAALASGNSAHLSEASVHSMPVPGAERRLGCCGTLGTYVDAR